MNVKLNEKQYEELENNGFIDIVVNQLTVRVLRTRDATHYAQAINWRDRKFICWIKAPKNKDGRVAMSIRKVLHFYGFPEEFCFFCGRVKSELGSRECFEVDHIVPLEDGGEDKASNCQIFCTACHKLKNWKRTYVVKHILRKKASV